jgi:hypothetical protein
MSSKIFREGFIPTVDQMPGEKTHARAKLIFNLLRVMVYFGPHKQAAALQELRVANGTLYDRVRKYLKELTPEEVKFFIGPRPTHHEDGTLAIYNPIHDNPLLMRVFAGEEPSDASKLWCPGDPVGHELGLLKNAGRIAVSRS